MIRLLRTVKFSAGGSWTSNPDSAASPPEEGAKDAVLPFDTALPVEAALSVEVALSLDAADSSIRVCVSEISVARPRSSSSWCIGRQCRGYARKQES